MRRLKTIFFTGAPAKLSGARGNNLANVLSKLKWLSSVKTVFFIGAPAKISGAGLMLR